MKQSKNIRRFTLEKIALAISIVLFIIGMIGTILPILPGAVLVYIGMIVYGFITKFESLSLYFFILQALVLLVTFLVDYICKYETVWWK